MGMQGAALKIHDRRSTDVLEAGEYADLVVKDPWNPEEEITVTRQFRCDPLARLHAHHQIDDCQYTAGRAYQRDWEVAERGARAIDPTREAVDGGLLPEPITDGQAKARKRLIRVRAELGRVLRSVTHAVLIDRSSIEGFAILQGRSGKRWANYYGKMFRDGLDVLAVEYGLSERR